MPHLKLLILIIPLFIWGKHTNAQSQNFYIPTWNKEKTKDFYNQNIRRLSSAIDSITYLEDTMPRYSFRKGAAYVSILSVYNNLKAPPDTIYQYAAMTYAISPNRFCYYWYRILNYIIWEGNGIEPYVKKERPILWEENCEKCRVYYDQIKAAKENITLEDNPYYDALQQIEEQDQKYRGMKNIDWKQQNRLDSLSRVALDSLFLIYGFPTKKALGGRNSMTAWLVLQHSDDCDWTKRWIKYFLDAQLNGNTNTNPLSATFIRFFHPKTGYCEDKKTFIQQLKKDYPASLAQKMGYQDFFLD